jgi:hypothetical protein
VSVVIEQFIPQPNVQDRRQVMIRAPAAMVLEVARNFHLQVDLLDPCHLLAPRPDARRENGNTASSVGPRR